MLLSLFLFILFMSWQGPSPLSSGDGLLPFALPVYSEFGYDAAREVMNLERNIYYRPDFAVSPFLHYYGGLLIDGVYLPEY